VLSGYERIGVIGGLGFIGRHLVQFLRGLGKRVVIVDNRCSADERGREGVECRVCDVADGAGLAQAIGDCRIVFHLAANANGSTSVRRPRWDFQTNCVGTFNVLDAAVQTGVERLVYVSSAAVYGRPVHSPMGEDHPTEPILPYGASKLAGERYCLTYLHSFGLPVVVGRPFCVYGGGEDPSRSLVEVGRYLRWHLNGLPIQVVGDGANKTRDFVHVADVVAALMLLAERAEPGEVFNIGSGTETSMTALAEEIGNATNRHPVIEELTHVTDDTYRLVADISKLRGLGYQPRRALSAELAVLAAELGERPALPSTDTIFRAGQTAERVADALAGEAILDGMP
jgi:UDP-glucose 4-epimerase